MLAVRKLVPGPGEPALVEVPIPEPGPGQVRVAVTATGICGTDIHLMRDEYRFYPPVTMGHEVAGRVDAVASDVDLGWVGALVALETIFSSCGACRWCRGRAADAVRGPAVDRVRAWTAVSRHTSSSQPGTCTASRHRSTTMRRRSPNRWRACATRWGRASSARATRSS